MVFLFIAFFCLNGKKSYYETNTCVIQAQRTVLRNRCHRLRLIKIKEMGSLTSGGLKQDCSSVL